MADNKLEHQWGKSIAAAAAAAAAAVAVTPKGSWHMWRKAGEVIGDLRSLRRFVKMPQTG